MASPMRLLGIAKAVGEGKVEWLPNSYRAVGGKKSSQRSGGTLPDPPPVFAVSCPAAWHHSRWLATGYSPRCPAKSQPLPIPWWPHGAEMYVIPKNPAPVHQPRPNIPSPFPVRDLPPPKDTPAALRKPAADHSSDGFSSPLLMAARSPISLPPLPANKITDNIMEMMVESRVHQQMNSLIAEKFPETNLRKGEKLDAGRCGAPAPAP